MSKQFSFYWHDYETFGTHPALDSPCQFAGLRTSPDLEEIEEPLVLHCQPPSDYLPDPAAILVTGITPQLALQEGVPDYQFAERIHREFTRPGTCGVGYNSIRFDDEFTRHLLYRNLYEPYSREWKNGNTRWDLIDVVRMTYALRPEGIEWPLGDNGAPSFRLEALTAANGIGHQEAHDALSDVRATIALARVLRERKAKLWEYALALRDKQQAARQLDIAGRKPVLHVSSRYPAAQGCIALVVPLARHPRNRNSVIVWNLAEDPRLLIDDSADQLRNRLYTPGEQLPEGERRPALKEVHCNRSPMLVTENLLDTRAADRHGIDLDACHRHRELLLGATGLDDKLARIFAPREESASRDPELSLYGGFIGDADRVRLERLRKLPPDKLGNAPVFDDRRLPELVFRYRARNFPETLSATERAEWREHCRGRLIEGKPEGVLSQQDCRKRIAQLRGERKDERDQALLAAVEEYIETLV